MSEEAKPKLEVVPFAPSTQRVEPVDNDWPSDWTYTDTDLAEDYDRELVSLAVLPHGFGLGHDLDALLGDGLATGDVVALGAPSAGGGKTDLLLQVANGLALRSAALVSNPQRDMKEPLTPVLFISEMQNRKLSQLTLAKLTRHAKPVFRSGRASERRERAHKLHHGYTAKAFEDARLHVIEGGARHRMTPWTKVWRPAKARGEPLLKKLVTFLAKWKQQLEETYGGVVWPIVMFDPLQRWQDSDLGEVEALNILAEGMDQLADEHGWIVFLTSDTNKGAAIGKDEKDRSAANIFRGSYKLFHSCDAVLTLNPEEYNPATPNERAVTVRVEKNRNGPSFGEAKFTYHPAWGLYVPHSARLTSAAPKMSDAARLFAEAHGPNEDDQ